MSPLLADQRLAIESLCRRYGVERLELFGSATTPAFDPQRSDYDFLVAFDRRHDGSLADRYLGLLMDLESLLGRKVDLVDIRAARNPYFIAEAMKHRELLYAA